uniref:Uncharacterized protein n=1 Tax=Palpitomonas bilix TaxID=652834 RepID=A0A7S3DIA2_9EUKA|mmetsp:Transcript_39209/g.100466  ORF Transcript_39209/g.100466 Transcript_39209/m.100466 type:complete len:262 (+) Transcript_39209:237-1022(+)|eukprot:CAMPEP_0113906092 /NCGR_PEP_ID=MMETSP0780_2-20120614/24502_1 /TAXON_ID=652834 /ORGANISM="Palpitomonas bilix" /LENGTH=261 /DNA_ID=CAMNT_0000900547 /DNA_START=67 /DNA_END=852 /DNA_ORIENTATION=+ /assembly_acc=CAM_ASM_000599
MLARTLFSQVRRTPSVLQGTTLQVVRAYAAKKYTPAPKPASLQGSQKEDEANAPVFEKIFPSLKDADGEKRGLNGEVYFNDRTLFFRTIGIGAYVQTVVWTSYAVFDIFQPSIGYSPWWTFGGVTISGLLVWGFQTFAAKSVRRIVVDERSKGAPFLVETHGILKKGPEFLIPQDSVEVGKKVVQGGKVAKSVSFKRPVDYTYFVVDKSKADYVNEKKFDSFFLRLSKMTDPLSSKLHQLQAGARQGRMANREKDKYGPTK